MTKKLFEIAADIVQAQASVGHMSADDIELTLAKTFVTLQKMQRAEEGGVFLEVGKSADEAAQAQQAAQQAEAATPQLDAKSSIREDKIVCLECGLEARQLTSNHLKTHNLTPKEYKRKYGFPLKQSLSARSLARARSKAAKKRGLPPNLAKYIENRRKKPAEAELPPEEAFSPEVAPPVAAEPEKTGRGAPRGPRKKKAE